MSDTYFKFIPTKSDFMPSEESQVKAAQRLREFLPEADQVGVLKSAEIQFIDAGSNYESVACPFCEEELEVGWWQEGMDKAYETRFAELAITLPCCGKPSSLNELNYDWPQGFALFILEARNPGVEDMTPNQLRELEEILKCSLRLIRSHI